jgi:hypothetical protein
MKMRMFLAIAIAAISSSVSMGQLQIVEEVQSNNGVWLPKYSRFVGGSSFWANGFDISGVGRSISGPIPNVDAILDHGTLVSGSFQFAANHSNRHVRVNEITRFYYDGVDSSDDLENSSNFEQRLVVASWKVAGTGDLQTSQLASPVSSGIAVYPILLFQNNASYNNVQALYFGKTRGSAASQRHHRVGKKYLTGAWNSSSSTGILFNYVNVNSGNYEDEECLAITGDSGSPTLAIQTGLSWGPIFAGAHWTHTSDSGITSATVRDNLKNEMAARQSGKPIHQREVPTFWTGIVGDFNGTFAIDPADMDIITREAHLFGTRGYNWYLDWDGNGQTNTADVDWVLFWIGKKRGDIDLDGDVDFDDFSVLSANFGTSQKGWAQGDFDGDGDVDFTDWLALSSNYGT